MQKNSTSINDEISIKEQEMGPRLSTINLLKQFARVYSYNVALQPGLRSFIPN